MSLVYPLERTSHPKKGIKSMREAKSVSWRYCLKIWLGRFSLTGLGLILGISICEWILFWEPSVGEVRDVWQIHGLFQLDDQLIYSLRSNASRQLATEEYVEIATTNERGLRNKPLREKGTYEKRILVLGDSMIFGHGVHDDQTFPNQLEMLFHEAGMDVDVVNAGVKGYGPDQYFKFFLSSLRDLQPNLVIFSLFVNDLRDCIDTPLYDLKEGALYSLDARKNWLYVRCRLASIFPNAILRMRVFRAIASRYAAYCTQNPTITMNAEEGRLWAQEKVLTQIQELERLGEADGFALCVLCIPSKEDSRDRYAWLKRVQDQGTWVMECHKDELWHAERGQLYFAVDQHMTPRGCKALARSVFEGILQSNLWVDGNIDRVVIK